MEVNMNLNTKGYKTPPPGWEVWCYVDQDETQWFGEPKNSPNHPRQNNNIITGRERVRLERNKQTTIDKCWELYFADLAKGVV
jgi:hypothetical protein